MLQLYKSTQEDSVLARCFQAYEKNKSIVLETGKGHSYDKLVIATGARPIIPAISGLTTATNVFTMRTAEDSNAIRAAVASNERTRVVVIGGGYIGLETAASLKKLGADVTVLEREERILARVTAPEMSTFFQMLHTENGVDVLANKNVISIETKADLNEIICSDNTRYKADIIIVGVGINVNMELAEEAGLRIENGIRVAATAQTNDNDIYAIGDCTYHHNPHYDRFVRLESVQNAVDQAKVAAANICEKVTTYDSLPWFWSDQYDVKLQMVGLSQGYDQTVTRKEVGAGNSLSTWYFKGNTLLAVDAVNNAKAYVYGTKFIKGGQKLNKSKLADPTTEFKPINLLAE